MLSCWSQADVDFQFSLQDTELPQTAAITHHHGAHRLLNLKIIEKDKKGLIIKLKSKRHVCMIVLQTFDGSMMTVGTKLRKMWLQSVRTVVLLKATSSSSMASSSRRSASL